MTGIPGSLIIFVFFLIIFERDPIENRLYCREVAQKIWVFSRLSTDGDHMSSVQTINLPSLQLQLKQIIDHMEMLAQQPDVLLQWGKEVGAELEDEGERLADLSSQIAAAHRQSAVKTSANVQPFEAPKLAVSP